MNQPLYESFTVYEPFDGTLDWGDDRDGKILNKFIDISENITEINTHMNKIVKINENADFKAFYANPNQKVTTSDALKHDMEYMMAQQKNTYTIGMVSIATLIIATVYIVGKYS